MENIWFILAQELWLSPQVNNTSILSPCDSPHTNSVLIPTPDCWCPLFIIISSNRRRYIPPCQIPINRLFPPPESRTCILLSLAIPTETKNRLLQNIDSDGLSTNLHIVCDCGQTHFIQHQSQWQALPHPGLWVLSGGFTLVIRYAEQMWKPSRTFITNSVRTHILLPNRRTACATAL